MFGNTSTALITVSLSHPHTTAVILLSQTIIPENFYRHFIKYRGYRSTIKVAHYRVTLVSMVLRILTHAVENNVGTAVSSSRLVWGAAPAEIEFGAF